MKGHEEKIYKDDGHFESADRLEYEQYLLTLKRFVKYCNDIIVVNEKGNFMLPKRRPEKSASGVWFFGGQVIAFKTLKESVIETFKREAGLKLPAKRFEYIGPIRHWHSGKEKEMTKHDALSEVFVVRLNKKEIQNIRLDESEFESSSLQEYNLKNIQGIKRKMSREIILELWKRYKKLK